MKDTWIDRYVYAVGKQLRLKNREDIEKELRYSMLDALEERTGKAINDGDYNESELIDYLIELGPPDAMAVRYGAHQKGLIGPELFEPYKMVLGIVVVIVSITSGIAFLLDAIKWGSEGIHVIGSVISLVASVISGCISAIGSVTVIFALIEHYGLLTEGEAFKQTDKWHPKQLPEIPVQKDRVSRGEMVWDIAWTTFALILFNVYLDKITSYWFVDEAGQFVAVPYLSIDVLKSYLLFFNTVWVLGLILDMYLVVKAKWQRLTRGMDMTLSLMTIVLLLRLFNRSDLINPEAAIQLGVLLPNTNFKILSVLQGSIQISIAITIILLLSSVISHLWKMRS